MTFSLQNFFHLLTKSGIVRRIVSRPIIRPYTTLMKHLKNEVRLSTKFVPVRTLEDDDFPTLHAVKSTKKYEART